MSLISNIILSSIRTWTPQVTAVRFRYHADRIARGPLVRRYGYDDPIDRRGVLHHGGTDRVHQMPIYRPGDSWSTKKALFGQNDYIDILGDGNIHPTKILTHIPIWLRGFKGNEYQVCLRRRKWWSSGVYPRARPTKWNHLLKRIKYLYTFMNRKTKTYPSRQ